MPKPARILSLMLAAAMLLLATPAHAQRFDQQRVDEAVVSALKYLADQQQPSGSWQTQAWGDSTAVTALAVMAFLSAGYQPGEGPYGEQINRGVRWVIEKQQPNGMLIQGPVSHGPMYNHGICTWMLAEVYGMLGPEDSGPARAALERGVRLILEAQAISKYERHQGGWRYQADSRDSDLSISGWQILALRSARDVGCDVPAEAMEAAVGYIKKCSPRNRQGFGYQPGNGPTQTLTGLGIACLETCGQHRDPDAIDGAEYLITHPLTERTNYFYYGVYYTGVGLFKLGEPYAQRHHRHLVHLLLPLQDRNGSWIPEEGSEGNAGPVYATSLVVMALTVNYRYLPSSQR